MLIYREENTVKKFKSAFFIVGVFAASISNIVSANANFEGLKELKPK